MSELLAAAAQALNAPEFLVERSAQARAAAAGSSVDDILGAWAGGEAVASTAAPSAEPEAPPQEEEAPSPAAAEQPPAPAEEAEPAVPSAPAAPVPAGAAVAVMEVEEEEPVVAAPLGVRIRAATRVGSVVGIVGGLLGLVFASQYLATFASTAGEEGALRAAIEVMPGRLVLGAILISLPIGLAVAGISRLIPGWIDPGMRLSGSGLPTAALGLLGGALVGAMAGGIVAGGGTPLELPEGFSSIPVLGAVIWTLAAWLAGGWAIAAVTQALGVPEGVESDEADEMATVRTRLVSAVGIPVTAALAIVTLVLSFAFVFISFPVWAPLTGTVLAGSIIAFAGLSASKPNMKVGVGELLVAAAGIGVVVLLIFAVLSATGSGSHGDDHAEQPEAVATEE